MDPAPHDELCCDRCGKRLEYEDHVNYSRHHLVTQWFKYWFCWKWQKPRCHDCGKPISKPVHKNCDDVPF